VPLKALVQDTGAYCSGTCAADSDCPIDYFCGPDYDQVTDDKTKYLCLKRTVCDTCRLNDECPAEFPVCVVDNNNVHYCSKTCNTGADCPGAPQFSTYMVCRPGLDAANNAGNLCFHSAGTCKGTGNVCDPCRNEFDCAGQSIAGLHCLFNTQTLERMCTKACQSDASCGGPNMSQCDDADPGTATNPGVSNFICFGSGDKGVGAGVLSCHI
jgi:hypothetical protein